MSFWSELGFRENPYSTTPIPPTAEGERLLVGRNAELERLQRMITASASHPTIEGDNGVGKTSLVSIAGYRLMKGFLLERSEQLFIPLGETFQLTSVEDLPQLQRRIYFAIARAFIEHNELITKQNLGAPNVGDVEKWLDVPLLRGRSGGVSVLGSGIDAGQTTSVNDAAGWNESGFQSTIDTWLSDCFPTPQAGGFIGVIDNLELLETSQKARALLEAMRDTVLSKTGLRWVLCGARGIVKSSASSARLAGVLGNPLDLGPLPDDQIPAMIQRRIETFAITSEAYVPVPAGGFKYIYERVNRNLRDALNMAEAYALTLEPSDLPVDPVTDFANWISDQALGSLNATRLPPRPWKVFDDLAKNAGSCSPSDFAAYGFNSAEAFRAPVKSLEDANLVISTKDDTDQRRKTITVTSRGWLVMWARGLVREAETLLEQEAHSSADSVETGD